MKKLAIFDFDGTLFTKETLPFLVGTYGKQGHSRIKQVTVYTNVLIDFFKYKMSKTYGKEDFRKNATIQFLNLFKGMNEEEIKAYFVKNIPAIMEYLNPKVLKELERAKMDGYETVLLSGCFTDVLKELSESLGIDTYIGTKLYYKPDGSGLDYSKALKVSSGENKVAFLRQHIEGNSVDWDQSRAYGDSHYDFGILNMVGEPVCVNPDDELRKIAKEKQWRILEG